MKPNKFDVIFIIFIIIIYFIISCFFFQTNNKGNFAVVITSAGEAVYSLYIDRIIEVQGHNGLTYINISEGGVSVTDSACPNKICVNHGKINLAGQIISCVPNGVYVFIENKKDDVDAVSK